MIAKKKAKAGVPVIREATYDVIVSPVITEKSTAAIEQGKYVFNIAKDANKAAVKSAVEALFGVKVTKVNVLNRLGKIKRFRSTTGKQSDVKKAIVTLQEGQSIDFAAGVK